MYILIHKNRAKDAVEDSEYIYDQLSQLFGKNLKTSHGGFRFEVFDIIVEFRFGEDSCKFRGLRPDYYYTNNIGFVYTYLKSVNSKEIKCIEEIPKIIFDHICSEGGR